MSHVGHSVHHDLQRDGDLLLDLLGGDTRPLRDNLHVVVGYVGVRFHRQGMERVAAPYE